MKGNILYITGHNLSVHMFLRPKQRPSISPVISQLTMSLDVTRKNSMANLCYTIRQNQRDDSGNGKSDSFDDLLRWHAMELEEDEPLSSGVVSSTSARSKRSLVNISTTHAKAPLLAGSPISFSSPSCSSSNADEDVDEDSDSESSESDSDSDSDSDIDFMVLNRDPSPWEDLVYPELTVKAPEFEQGNMTFIPQPTQPVYKHESMTVFASDCSATLSPRPAPFDPVQFTSPFHSPTLSHRAFTPGPITISAEVGATGTAGCLPPTSPPQTSTIEAPRRLAKRKRAPASSKRTSKARITSIPDDDEEYEENPSGDDDEYAPSPLLAPKSRRRGRAALAPRHHPRKGANPASGSSSQHTTSNSTPKRRRIAPESRNQQSDSPILLEAIANTSVESCDFVCPVCGWEQSNKRMPDYQRHLKTHLRPDREDRTRGWWCKGVRIEDKDDFNARCEDNGWKMIQDNTEPYWFHDHMRVGGCCQTFSRRDALKRHMTNSNVRCGGVIAEGLKEGDN
ncbi:hypothetical protein J3R30DRAFT_2110248 [Lentinula aciculospora]|uniref:Uncharacterized protein n=1 Tax=Lentinula aciculospora TaxID=153920 RepID=A0A9W9AHW3_9AGAR|nr:hypothetical protein J3R30DRAFT_2110248 [Lentinula aciculospora]